MMLWLAVVTSTAYAQKSDQALWDEWARYHCNSNDKSLTLCKERFRRETIEKQRKQDSIRREKEFSRNQADRESWAREKERRDKLSVEEFIKEEEERQEGQQFKKVNKTGKTIDEWEFYFAGLLSTKTGNAPNYDPVTGLQFGVEKQIIPISEDISLGVGAAYSMQGGKYKSSDYIPGGNYSTTSRTSRLNYLNFPVFIRYKKASNGFFAEAGVQPGLLLSAKDKGTTTTDIKDEIKKFDVGIPIGVGYKFKNKIGVGLRITPGLINVNKDKQYNNRNMVASLRASYSL